ncbi:receptor-like cytosolic serine/threonine-protein kinase RBK1 [Durio zibethinus]|uniref:Receptor-like cytosolic serine/threonine-protein kinase RBK1 n=1 Tax=Durio zibethinus TaxID=66656 RepID=A0A6P6AWK3_DURZI|nr:receptor-like cytosolic serine/threonine-protein kinase RBK1 [Durio zibethinus]
MVIKKEIAASRQVVYHGELLKSAMLGKDLVSINVFSDSDLDLLRAWMTKDRRDLSMGKWGNLNSPISQTSSTRKILKKIAQRFAAMAVFMGRDTEEALWSWISYARCSVNQSLSISYFLAIDKGILLEILRDHHLEGSNLRPKLYLKKNSARLRHADQEPESEKAESPAFRAASDVARDYIEGPEEGNSNPNHNHKAVLLNSISVIRRELPEPHLGWPLLRRKSSPNQEFKKPEPRDISVVEWVMSLPNRGTTVVNQIALLSNQTSINSGTNTNDSTNNDRKTEEAIHISEEESVINDNRNFELENKAEVSVSLNTKYLESYSKPGWPLRLVASTTSDSFSEYEAKKKPKAEREMNAPIQSTIELPPSKIALVSTEMENPVQIENCLPTLRNMPTDLDLRCKKFSLRELKQATSGFCPENLIGEGGCSKVYKGCLPGGKQVAVKILKSYKEAWSDFSLETDIVSSMKHKHITHLKGVCVEDDHLISVYDFFSRGSLKEILHGQSRKSVLPWEVRFKIATAIAEALNYLHNECSPPIIHRDVKSSNILLSDDFQPQLSDFGLAIRGPTDSTYMIASNVVGTFGYIAPEYLMEGRVSDKIDVYSFGVVLLELLSGKRPICSKALEGQVSLIQWARALLERRNLRGLVDPALHGDFDVAQMQRMVLAASLCLNQLDGCRPKMSQVLEILRGEREPREWYNFLAADFKVRNNRDDRLSPAPVHKQYTHLSVSFTDNDSTSVGSNYTASRCRAEKERLLMLKNYLRKERG